MASTAHHRSPKHKGSVPSPQHQSPEVITASPTHDTPRRLQPEPHPAVHTGRWSCAPPPGESYGRWPRESPGGVGPQLPTSGPWIQVRPRFPGRAAQLVSRTGLLPSEQAMTQAAWGNGCLGRGVTSTAWLGSLPSFLHWPPPSGVWAGARLCTIKDPWWRPS